MPIPRTMNDTDSYFDAAANLLAMAADDNTGRNLEKRQMYAQIAQGYALLAQCGVAWITRPDTTVT